MIFVQCPLDAPSNFSVYISNTSNTTFLLSWGAPFSLDVTDSPDISYYTLCTNIGCKNISSDPDCTFPRTCTSSVNFTGPSLNGTNGGQNKTMVDYGDTIYFTFFAVNGAGKGNVSKPFFFKKESDCKKGGLVILRHNEIRDCIGDLASQVWPQVIKEPIVNEATATSSDPGLRLDLGIRGVWQPQVEALFDVRVIDTDAAPSHCHRAPNAILESSSQEKKRMYKKAVEDRRGTFTPFVLSVDGLLHKEASHFIKHMATALSSKWDKAYSITSSYI
eukprot:Em0001g3101a